MHAFLCLFSLAGAWPAVAATVTADFSSAGDVPVSAAGYTASGNDVSLSLNFIPATGTTLTVVENSGLDFIVGTFSNLSQGQWVSLGYGGINYRFYADYYGGTGNDLVLHWLRRGVASWGSNTLGQLGNGNLTSKTVPTEITNSGALAGKIVSSVAAGGGHTLALCSDGTLVAWGSNSSGQLGIGSTVSSNLPVAVSVSGLLAGKTVVSISAGISHSLAVCLDGTIAAWGANSSGQLGDGTTTLRNVPTLVIGSGALLGKTVTAVSGGSSHSLALCSDGTVAAWGANGSGQLGNNVSPTSSVPVAVDTTGVLSSRVVVAISAGSDFSLALCSDGSVAAWGAGGRLGIDGSVGGPVPVLVDSSGVLAGKTVTSISAGSNFSLAIRSDGVAVAWGSNESGQLGTNSTVASGAPVLVDASGSLSGKTVVSLSAGTGCSSAVCSDGSVAAWGRYTPGGSGDRSLAPVLLANPGVLAGKKPLRIESGSLFFVAVFGIPPGTELSGLALNEGALSPAVSPGVTEYFGSVSNPTSAFGIIATPKDASPLRVNGTSALPGTLFPLALSPGLNTVMVQVGPPGGVVSDYKLTILVGNILDVAFGSAADPPLQAGGFDFSGISVNFSIGFRPPTGTALLVARNAGLGFFTGKFTNLPQGKPVSLTYGGKVYPFVANYYGGDGNDLVLEWRNRSIAAWGYNSYGQLGVSPSGPLATPVAITGLGELSGRTVTAVAAGAVHSLALCSDGTVASWGNSDLGQLGNGFLAQSTAPVAVFARGVLSGKQVAGISAANVNNLAVCSDGSVAAWGYGLYGQLGNGTTAVSSFPVAVSLVGPAAGKKVVSAAVGGTHCLAVCSDGSVLAWGKNDLGQLGDGTTTDRLTPVLVSTAGALAGKTVVAVSGGYQHSLGLCSDGTLVAWGLNTSGQLGGTGNDSFVNQSTIPIIVNRTGVLAGKSVVALSQAAHSTSIVLCSDGTAVSWGLSVEGERGSSGGSSVVPGFVNTAGVLSGKSISYISSGGSSSLAVCSDGTAVTWGSNTYQQLGNSGSAANSLPVSVFNSDAVIGKKALFGAVAYHCILVLADPVDGYLAWKVDYPLLVDKSPMADPDRDGIPNLMEYVLHGNPSASSTTQLPTVSANGSDFVFNFNRLASSVVDTTQIFQYSADMVQWTSVNLTAGPDVSLGNIDSNTNQSVTVIIPKGANTQLFGRLKVQQP